MRRIEDADWQALALLARLKLWAHGRRTAYTPREQACQACGLCVVACPEGAIALVAGGGPGAPASERVRSPSVAGLRERGACTRR